MSGPDMGDAAPAVTADPWAKLAELTPARLALGRAGAGLPTREVLRLGMAHARARDAVHATLDADAIEGGLRSLNLNVLRVESAAPDRDHYLRRPDLGRRLSRASRDALARPSRENGGREGENGDVAVVVADGLSATGVNRTVVALLEQLVPLLRARGLRVGPAVLARQARVALGDEIGQLLAARLVVVLIGERPGLSSPDSVGAYLTFEPRVGRTDAERNCVSNIRAGGLPPASAAATLSWLIGQALVLSLTGVRLKDDSAAALGSASAAAPVEGPGAATTPPVGRHPPGSS